MMKTITYGERHFLEEVMSCEVSRMRVDRGCHSLTMLGVTPGKKKKKNKKAFPNVKIKVFFQITPYAKLSTILGW
jgi:hypothetical protein